MENTSVVAYRGVSPQLDADVFVGSGTRLSGDLVAEAGVNFWFNVAARGDVNHIRIGAGTNIQDNCVIHVTTGGSPTLIGAHVTVGHSAVLHACTIQDYCLIGIGAVVMDDALIPKHSFVAAGALVTPRSSFPEGSLIIGSPARVQRPLKQEEIDYIHWSAEHYRRLANEYKDGQ